MSADRPAELTGPFAEVIRRLVRLGWPRHGDPAVEQTAMRARDVLASVGCGPDDQMRAARELPLRDDLR